MTAWYERTFGREYLSLYRHRDDAEAAVDVEQIIRLISPPRTEPLLDLCCGAGRHLAAFWRAGYTHLTGIDLSADLLDAARTRFDADGITGIRLVRADMRDLSDRSRYATIVSLFTSFGYFESEAEDARVLHAAHRALRPNGTFLMDTLNRAAVVSSLVGSEKRVLDSKCLHIRRRITPDGRRVEKLTRVSQPGSPETAYRESVRMYERADLDRMLAQAGFSDIRFCGALDGRPYAPDAPRLVATATRRKQR